MPLSPADDPSSSSADRPASRRATIVEVTRRAKRVVLKLSSGWAFVIEPRMTGLMLVSDLRMRAICAWSGNWDCQGQRSLWFWDRRGLGTISLLDPEQLARLFSDADLGREALEADAELWSHICQTTARPIKVLMLDQSKIAGLETCMRARSSIRPASIPRHPQLS